MTDLPPTASLPVAWLKPMAAGYKIPLWRWIIIPATTIMLKRRGGVWLSGTLELGGDSLRFVQTRLSKSSRGPLDAWAIPLASIANIAVKQGMVSETIDIAHGGTITTLMGVRSADFVALLQQAVPRP